MAMRQENVDFVKLFIENGLKLNGFFTKEDLQTLYEDKYNILEPLMEQSLFNKLKSLGYNLPLDLDVIRRRATGCYMDNHVGRKGMENSAAKQTSDGNRHDKISLEHLFVWCLMVKNQDLAKMFWKELKEPVAAALFAIGLFDAVITTKKLKKPEKLQILQNNTGDFVKLAMEMMNKCYTEKKWFEILLQKLDNWNNKSCLILASNTKNIGFMSHTACQEVMDYLWWGQFELSSVPYVAWYSTLGIKDVFADTKLKESVLGFYCSPVVIFGLHVVSYLIFLGLYSYLMLVKFNPYFTIVEGVVCFWVFTIACEEIRQIYNSDTDTVRLKIKTYWSDSWNKLDIFTLVLFIIGIILRIIPDAYTFEAARVILCLNLVFFYFRMLHIFFVNKHLGPKIQMISKMVRKDLIPFMAIILVFILAYSLASEAILYPNTELSLKLLYHLPRKAYWHVYGELFLEDIEGTSACTNDPALYNDYITLRCPSEVGKYAVPILLGIFMLVMVILLLNLLIAMFSHTFQRIQEQTYPYWCYQRYQLIHEYYFRPVLPPPLIFLAHVVKFFRHCFKNYRGSENVIHPESTFRLNFNVEKKKKISVFEKAMAKACLMKLHKDPQSMGRDDFRKDAMTSTTDFSDVLTKLSVIHGLVDKNEENVSENAVSTMDKASPGNAITTIKLPAVTHATLLEEGKATVKPIKSDQQPLKSDVSTVSSFRKRSLHDKHIGGRLEYRKLDNVEKKLDQFERRIEKHMEDMVKENRDQMERIIVNSKEMERIIENSKEMERIIENSKERVSRVSRPSVLSSKVRGYLANGICHCHCATCRAAMTYAQSIRRRFQQLKSSQPDK
ncbi:transient receptor potential cation channel subfamily M member 1 isoform X2 [Patella vulgata]|nr:transient receptor potential cation channel subfamily M member 1 isoform X2 [Patella vulgata]